MTSTAAAEVTGDGLPERSHVQRAPRKTRPGTSFRKQRQEGLLSEATPEHEGRKLGWLFSYEAPLSTAAHCVCAFGERVTPSHPVHYASSRLSGIHFCRLVFYPV